MALAHLEKVSPLAGTQATDVLQEGLAVWVGNGAVDIHSHLVDPVDELTVQGAQKVFLHHVLLVKQKRDLSGSGEGRGYPTLLRAANPLGRPGPYPLYTPVVSKRTSKADAISRGGNVGTVGLLTTALEARTPGTWECTPTLQSQWGGGA